MKVSVTPIKISGTGNLPTKPAGFSQIWRLTTGTLLLTSLVACATVPSESVDSVVVPDAPDTGLASANVMYNTRNYAGAVQKFDTIITNPDASANSRRLSHLGKALIYLSTDENWRSIEKVFLSRRRVQ